MLRAIAVLLFAALILVAPPATAGAATYDVHVCSDPGATGFVASTNSDLIRPTAGCPAKDSALNSGLFVGVRPSLDWPADDTSAAWTLTAPAGTTVRSFTLMRTYRKSSAGYEIAVVAGDDLLEGCSALAHSCFQELNTITFGPLAVHSIVLRVTCAVGPCQNDDQDSPATFDLKSATVALDDPAPPVIAPLAFSTWQRSAAVAVSATDVSGVSRLSVLADGNAASTLDESCDYRHLQPCPTTVNETLMPNLADGVHTVTVTASDAAGQAQTSAPATLRIDRKAPAAPIGLSVQRVADSDYVYTWHNPDETGAAPIVAAHWSDGSGETVTRGDGVSRLEAADGDGKVWLEDAAGNADPANAAVVGAAPNVVSVQKPILKTTAPSAKLKVAKVKRSGGTLTVSGTIVKAATGKVSVTAAGRTRSGKPKHGRFTIKVPLGSGHRKGKLAVTVRYGGQGGFAPATVKKTLSR